MTDFTRVRIPETGAHWDCPTASLEVLGLAEHVVKGKETVRRARRAKSKKNLEPAVVPDESVEDES